VGGIGETGHVGKVTVVTNQGGEDDKGRGAEIEPLRVDFVSSTCEPVSLLSIHDTSGRDLNLGGLVTWILSRALTPFHVLDRREFEREGFSFLRMPLQKANMVRRSK